MKASTLIPEKRQAQRIASGSTLLSALSALLMTLALFSIFYALFGIYPFGVKSIVWCDMEQQGVPLLLQFKRILEQGEWPLYHQLNAGGMNFYGIYFFFLSNPFSYVALLTDIPISSLMNLIVPMKLALAAGAMVIWLRYRHKHLPGVTAVLLGLMYAFCGYGLMYYQNLMWLDVQALAPLLLLSVELLLHRGKLLPYFFAIGLQIVLCYYIGYMTVIFLLLYVGLYAFCASHEARRTLHFFEFWLTSFCAALATAFVWLPSFLQIARSARSGNLIEKLTGNYVFDSLSDKFGLLAATGLVFAVIPFLLRRSAAVSKNEYWRRVVLFGLLVIGTLIDPINAMWHTGSYQAFPYRWAFWVILLSLTYAAELLTPAANAEERKSYPFRSQLLPLGLTVAALGAVVLLLKFCREDMISYVQTLWVDEKNVLLLLIPTSMTVAAYLVVIRRYRLGKMSYRTVVCLCALLFGGEMSLHTYCNVCAAAEEDTLYTQTVSAADRIEDEDFYRVKLTRKYAHANMVGALGYPTMAHYTSLTRADYLEGVKKMGYSSYWMEVPSTGGTVLTDALWGVRYQLGQQKDFPEWVTEIWTDQCLSIGKSAVTLPQAIRVEDSPTEIAELPDGPRSQVQAYLAEQKLGRDDVVTVYPHTQTENVNITTDDDDTVHCNIVDPDKASSDVRFAFFVEGEQYLYFDLYSLTGTEIGNPRNESIALSVNGHYVESKYPQNSHNGLISLGTFCNEYVTVRAVVLKNFTCESFGVFGISADAMDAAAKQLAAGDLAYENGSYTVTTQGDAVATLVLAIPYDEGFSATVNGQPAEVYRVNTCETAVVVPAGEAVVTLSHIPSGLRVGVLLSFTGAALMLLYFMLRRSISPALQMRCAKIAFVVTNIALGTVIAVIYLFPVVAYFGYYVVQWLF